MDGFVDAEGNFTESFKPAEILGEGYEDYKGLDEVKNIQSLVKFAADNHRSARSKLENVIQKPKENATDEEKAAYTATLRTELGIPAAEGEYNWPEPAEGEEPLPDGTKEFWNNVFKEAGIPQSQAELLIAKTKEFNAMAAEAAKKDMDEAIEQQMKEDIEAFDKLYPGEKKPEALRHAIAAIEKFGSDTLKQAIKNGNMYDEHDLNKWADFVPLNNLPFLANVGKVAANSTMPSGQPGAPLGDARIASIASANNTTVEEIKKAMANYPNSWQSMYRMPD